ncbi:glucosaminidase domain-containing protein [Burkholderia oklahomensis]|uniref:glycoside hydrolase family 73 protein n=1 Tax=Burkholderia oklahomensis TaxID=342113 RepID=UPI00264E1EB5|nr:glucosaminidase domain-containing protein [Burkholderia oklahomensis]MDN7675489.1 glucosaminidase domain-containing protein [Burkholderia oklahomensis]
MFKLDFPVFASNPADVRMRAPLRGEGAERHDFRAELTRLQRDIARSIAEGFDAGGFDVVVSGAVSAPAGFGVFASSPGSSAAPNKQAFLDAVWPFARTAGAALGVSGDLVAAHAALESGWGQRPLTAASGVDSYNLFGIKAGADWQGRVADVLTTEYAAGQPLKTVERFRAYSDYRHAFDDYVTLLSGNARYRGAMGAGGDAAAFAAGLVRGGYATDPAYAAKLSRVAADVAAARGVNAPRMARGDPPARPFLPR